MNSPSNTMMSLSNHLRRMWSIAAALVARWVFRKGCAWAVAQTWDTDDFNFTPWPVGQALGKLNGCIYDLIRALEVDNEDTQWVCLFNRFRSLTGVMLYVLAVGGDDATLEVPVRRTIQLDYATAGEKLLQEVENLMGTEWQDAAAVSGFRHATREAKDLVHTLIEASHALRFGSQATELRRSNEIRQGIAHESFLKGFPADMSPGLDAGLLKSALEMVDDLLLTSNLNTVLTRGVEERRARWEKAGSFRRGDRLSIGGACWARMALPFTFRMLSTSEAPIYRCEDGVYGDRLLPPDNRWFECMRRCIAELWRGGLTCRLTF